MLKSILFTVRDLKTWSKVCVRGYSFSQCHFKQQVKSTSGRKSDSINWIRRQINDPYVRQAKIEHYRCRSAFKLLEIDDKYQFLKPGYSVIDCGACPGSWTQVAIDRVRSKESDGNETYRYLIGKYSPN